MKFYTMLQEVDMDEVSNFFNILFKNKLQYKLIVIFFICLFFKNQSEKGDLLIQTLIMVKYLFF